MELQLILAFLSGILILLLLIIRFKFPAFISLLIASILTALIAGLSSAEIIDVVKNGMGGTLGFVATVVGLGTIFGGILEKTNGAKVIAQALLGKTGEERAPIALMIAGFIVAIPVFFDVGFIILFPIILALHQKTKKSMVYYAVPLLAGLAVTHACIPPTPGPIAVAEILNASLGWVIILGIIIGIPMAYLGGVVYGKRLSKHLQINVDSLITQDGSSKSELNLSRIFIITLLPILLIVLGTLFSESIITTPSSIFNDLVILVGHPFTALILANIFAWIFLGRANQLKPNQLLEISNKSLYPAGIIILVTGAGGVYKQTLIETGLGEALATGMQSIGLGIIVFAFLAATVIRVLQGSATVAMITAAGLVAPLLINYNLSSRQLACLVIAISSGATMLSHLNDSGFWLVKEYLQMTELQAMKTWTFASTIIGLTGATLSIIIFYL